MARVALEKLVPGMQLKEPVLNPHGVLLLRAGEILTEKHLQIFRTWQIHEVDVLGANGGEPDATAETVLPRRDLETIQAEVGRRFRRADPATNPVMAEILRVVTLRLVRRRAAGQGQMAEEAAR